MTREIGDRWIFGLQWLSLAVLCTLSLHLSEQLTVDGVAIAVVIVWTGVVAYLAPQINALRRRLTESISGLGGLKP